MFDRFKVLADDKGSAVVVAAAVVVIVALTVVIIVSRGSSEPEPQPVEPPEGVQAGSDFLLGLGFDRCQPAAWLSESYLAEASEELKAQIDQADLPTAWADECFYSADEQVDGRRLLAIDLELKDKLGEVLIAYGGYDALLTRYRTTPPYGFNDIAEVEAVEHSGYRYVDPAGQSACGAPPPSEALALLKQLLDEGGYDYLQRGECPH